MGVLLKYYSFFWNGFFQLRCGCSKLSFGGSVGQGQLASSTQDMATAAIMATAAVMATAVIMVTAAVMAIVVVMAVEWEARAVLAASMAT